MADDITRELREWGDARFMSTEDRKMIRNITNRIDAAHEKAVKQAINSFVGEVAGDREAYPDDLLAECGLVRLPVDADGEPWRFGDRCGNGEKLSAIHLYANGNGRLDFRGGTKMEVVKGRTTARHRRPTPAERIRDWVERVYGGDDEDSRELLAIADELEGDADFDAYNKDLARFKKK